MKDLQYYTDQKVEITTELYKYTKTGEKEQTNKYDKVIDGLVMMLRGLDIIIEDMNKTEND